MNRNEALMRHQPQTVALPETVERFHDRGGACHRVLIRQVPGGWQVIDIATRVLDQLDAATDDRVGAEAIARAFAEEHRWPPRP
jgi:hypothetical protein